MHTLGFTVRRVAQAIIVVLGVLLLTFALSHFIPGGAARAALGVRATRAQVAAFNYQNGYDLPLWDQLYHYVDNALHLNLGYSYKNNAPVMSLISSRLPKTLLLVGLALGLAFVIAIPVGIIQAVRRNSVVDYAATGASYVLYAMPDFLIGLLLILYFAVDLHWFSVFAPQASTVGGILSQPRALVLPVVTLASTSIAAFSRYMRSSMMDVLSHDYVRTARAKGASPKRVLFGHALRNSFLSIITLIGLYLPYLVSGAVIDETVFNYPGMGLLTVNAASEIDIPTILGTTIVATVATVAGSLIADLLYVVVDPRVRYGSR